MSSIRNLPEERMSNAKNLFSSVGIAMALLIAAATAPAFAQEIDRTQLPIPDDLGHVLQTRASWSCLSW